MIPLMTIAFVAALKETSMFDFLAPGREAWMMYADVVSKTSIEGVNDPS